LKISCNYTLTVILVLLSYCISIAQVGKIQGLVIQKDSQKPVPFANVFLEGTNVGTFTDAKGVYSLNNIAEGNYILVISSVGYEPGKLLVSVKGEETTRIDFVIEESVVELPSIIVQRVTLTGGMAGLEDIPGSAYYLSPKELGKFGYNDVNRTLRLIPGLNIQEEDGYGLRPNIGMRGTGSERSSKITLMEDGVLMAPAPYAAPAAYYFPTIGRMQAVEILKGASQIKYGPFTTGGAINLISTQIPTDFRGVIKVSAGSFGNRLVHTNIGDSRDNFGFLVETYQNSSDGFKELDNGENTGFDKKDYLAKFKINTNIGAKVYQALTFKIGQTTEVSNETYLGLTESDFKANPYRRYAGSQRDIMKAKQSQVQLRHVIRPFEFMDVTTTAYRSDFSRNWYKLEKVQSDPMVGTISIANVLADPGAYSNEFAILNGSTSTVGDALYLRNNNRDYFAMGLQSTLGLHFENDILIHDLELGFRVHKDQIDRFQWYDQYRMENGVMELTNRGIPGTESNRVETANAVAAFAQYKLRYGKLTATPGLRFESVEAVRLDYGKDDVNRTGKDLTAKANNIDVFIPGLGLDYKFSKRLSGFIGINRGFAPPGSKEGTKAEKSINYEAGIRTNYGYLSTQAIFFFNDYSNLLGSELTAAGGNGSADQINGGEVDVKGLELLVAYDFVQSQQAKFRIPLTLVYTFTDAKFKNDFDSQFDPWGEVKKGYKLPYISNHQFALGISFEHIKFSLNFTGKYSDKMRTEAGQGDIPSDKSIDNSFIGDISVHYKLNTRFRIIGDIKNITDQVYSVSRRPSGLRPGLPRSFAIGLNVSF